MKQKPKNNGENNTKIIVMNNTTFRWLAYKFEIYYILTMLSINQNLHLLNVLA